MTFQVDAWLERKDPMIRVIDADTGWEFLRLEAKQVHELMESGDLCPSDLENDVTSCAALIALVEEQVA
jgi:hypothetical protein